MLSGPILGLGSVTVNGMLDLTGATYGPGAATLPSLTINGSTLVTDGDLTVAGPFTWAGSALLGVAGRGSVTVRSDMTLNGGYYVRDLNLVNAGHAVWSGGRVVFDGASRFTNLAGATFDDQVDGSFGGVHPVCPVFDNQGLFVKSGGAGVTDLDMQLYNSGTVRIDNGLLNIGCGYVQVVNNSGSTGQISGGFTGDVSVSNPGNLPVTPSETPPTPVSNYTQTATGNLTEVIGGLTPGTQYGQIVVTGSVNLAGTLQVQLINGFVPAVGDQFVVIDNRGTNPIAGTFAGLPEGATVWAGPYGFTVSYVGGDGNDLALTYAGVAPNDLSGRVFDDRNNDGLFNGADAGIEGVALLLIDSTGATVATANSAPDGRYSFHGVFPAGVYRVVAGPPANYLDGKETAGTLNGTVDNSRDSNTIADITLAAGGVGSGYNFGYIRPSRLQALVWEDANDNGQVDFGERAIAGVSLTLTGVDDRGNAVNLPSLTTSAQGIVEFLNLRPGRYTLTEAQPSGYLDGKDVPGTVNGVVSGDASVNDRFSGIALADPGSDAVNYNFGERPLTVGEVTAGQTASIGFWQNKQGQALITALNGGSTSTRLGNWLATTFPNLYGAGAGANNLANKTNAKVAALYVSLFKGNGQTSPGGPPKLDAQVMATALAVYVTDSNLAGNAAVAYGFRVTAGGVGASTFNVGAGGAAFGVANQTTMTVLDILRATDARTYNGLLYDLNHDGVISASERALRTQANDVYSAINELGGL